MELTHDELSRFRCGIYLHYKWHLYEADHLTHNASEGDRIEIHYVGLQLDEASEGPRHATREFREFLHDRVHEDGSRCGLIHKDYPAHLFMCGHERLITLRFRYLGPVFASWMLSADPWKQ